MADLSVDFAGVSFATPVVVNSSSLTADRRRIERLIACGAAGIVTKTVARDPLPGARREFSTGRFVDSLAVATDPRLTPGEAIELIDACRENGVPAIANVLGRGEDLESWAEICAAMESAGASMIELDLNSAPDPESHAKYRRTLRSNDVISIGQDPESTAIVVRAAVDAVSIPVVSKLNVSAPDVLAVAEAARDAGSAALSGVNALYSVGDIDLVTGRSRIPGLTRHSVTPVSGPALAVLGTKYTARICAANDIPYLSGSGVMTSEDVLTRILLGASLVGVCTAIYVQGPSLITTITTELESHCARNGITSIRELIGRAQSSFVEPEQVTSAPTVCRIQDHHTWRQVGESVFERSELVCNCIRKTGTGSDVVVSFSEGDCTGCGLPAWHAPAGVLTMRPRS